ncbi:hypothetical protein AVEN_165067-1 [Araneus ventricosus]|uniref:40S ribosomal protein S12 n=2 Tax=Araneus ventricosus TaxID=182803 RepID=A0A4Y2WRX5_ARAVE|nr:hypothetical protein AVEN_165067-1 [Araneus ventricosus]
MQYLESEKSKEKTEAKQLKRKALEEEIDFLKEKKMFLQTDIHQTNEKANDLAEEAEKSKDINLFIQSHELRKTISEKEIKIKTLDVDSNKKLGEWAGLCTIDKEGKARKVVGCSCVVVVDYGKETQAHDVLNDYFKSKRA